MFNIILILLLIKYTKAQNPEHRRHLRLIYFYLNEILSKI